MCEHDTLDASPRVPEAVKQAAASLELSQVATIRLAMSLFSKIAAELDKGATLVLRDKDSNEHEIWLSQLGLGKPGEN